MTTFELASQEHPSYTFADDVTLPSGFTDSSYHHDEGPSFRHVSNMCAVSFNYPSGNPRASLYVVATTLNQRGIDSGEARHYWYKCMTWPDVLEAIDTLRKRTGNEANLDTFFGDLEAVLKKHLGTDWEWQFDGDQPLIIHSVKLCEMWEHHEENEGEMIGEGGA